MCRVDINRDLLNAMFRRRYVAPAPGERISQTIIPFSGSAAWEAARLRRSVYERAATHGQIGVSDGRCPSQRVSGRPTLIEGAEQKLRTLLPDPQTCIAEAIYCYHLLD